MLPLTLLSVCAVGCASSSGVARGPVRGEPEVALAPIGEGDAKASPQIDGTGGDQADVPEDSPCAVEHEGKSQWVDRMQGRVMTTICATTRWFDGYFGEGDENDEYHTPFGRLGAALVYDEVDDFDIDTVFKARLQFPRLERRVSAFIGRYDEDEFVQDRQDELTSLPEVFAVTEDEEWLLGLGYRPAARRRSRLDVDAGIRLGFPMDPFVKARWKVRHPIGEQTLMRFRQTGFWRNSLGLGTTTQLDVERMLLGTSLLTRWRTEATMAEKTEGIDWQTSITVFQRVFDHGALAYQAVWDGETEAPVTVSEGGLRVIFRHRFLRDWLFLEIRGRSRWVRQYPDEPRVHSLGAAFGFEMLFGKKLARP